jgi:hypothetical protein
MLTIKRIQTQDDLSALENEINLLAQKLIWWQSAAQTLKHPLRFVAQVMTIGTHQEIEAVRQYYGEDIFSQVLNTPPAGVFDEKSWSYWHLMLRRLPVPSLPLRRFE